MAATCKSCGYFLSGSEEFDIERGVAEFCDKCTKEAEKKGGDDKKCR